MCHIFQSRSGRPKKRGTAYALLIRACRLDEVGFCNTSICLRLCLIFRCWFLEGIYHYWKYVYVFSRGLKQLEEYYGRTLGPTPERFQNLSWAYARRCFTCGFPICSGDYSLAQVGCFPIPAPSQVTDTLDLAQGSGHYCRLRSARQPRHLRPGSEFQPGGFQEEPSCPVLPFKKGPPINRAPENDLHVAAM